jgi:hypothetical protein
MDTARSQDNGQDSGVGPETVAAETPGGESALRFSVRQWCSLLLLRRRYQQSHDDFSERELVHLGFLRWLHHSGKLAS